ncbi:ATP-dependent RNA helicase DHX36 [Pyrus ussuriensis x Pyrus communis]|uniref:RNA helicase n=1 Tax=Pyrus ussuriensis x Pyrus communis TaxID=2448454 RepID=A0A5N5GAS9_9ROSA|nr:ATP-dependent RNA helicase DHX36 [Pyrus ussuriensis x Pyrus communis]
MVGRLLPPHPNGKTTFAETPSGGKVHLHVHSVNTKLSYKANRREQIAVAPTNDDNGDYNDKGSDVDDREDGSDEGVMEIDSKPSGQREEKIMSSPDNTVKVIVNRWLHFGSKAQQQEGRAGRCQPGICYHLYSKLREASLPEFQEPEIKRMPSRRNGAASLYVMRNGAANLRGRPSHSVGHMLIRLPRAHARSLLRLIQLRGRSIGMAPGR